MNNFCVLIPAFNEARTIGRIVAELKAKNTVHVYVVDDGSSDGTSRIVGRFHRRHRNVEFIDRSSKRVHGLTASVTDAAMRARTGKIIVMDGDMQHPPAKVRQLFLALDSCPIAVCVRTDVRNWGLHRRLISKGMAGIAYAAFKLRRRPTTRDMMSGFFGIRSSDFKRLIRKHRGGFVMQGYKVFLDILRMSEPGTRVAEVPYATFHERKEGKSKFNPKHMAHTLASAFR